MNWNVPTYGFGYNGDAALQHLAGIGSNVGTTENYTFSYGTIGALVSPWGGNYGSVRTLATAGNTGIGVAHTFGYNGFGRRVNGWHAGASGNYRKQVDRLIRRGRDGGMHIVTYVLPLRR